jgi:putative ATP-binding cassette transporter
METEGNLLGRLCRVGLPYWVSEQRRRALFLLLLVFALLAAVTVVNVWVAAVAGKFSTALQAKDRDAYYYLLLLHIAVIFIAAPLIVIYHYIKARIALEWRQWMSEHLISKYFTNLCYYKLSSQPDIDNPDERISQDMDSFCNLTVGLTMSVIDSVITILTFAGLLYTISPKLSLVVVIYCLVGCMLTYLIGKRLPKLNFEHLKLEADLRYSLAQVRRDFESIAFFRGEERTVAHIVKNLVRAMKNVEEIIVLNRNLGFFTSIFNWFVALIPAALIAPLYFNGSVEFGEITRGGIAFTHVFNGLSLFISQFGALSSYKANIDRLGSFMEQLETRPVDPCSTISLRIGTGLELESVTILTPDYARVLVKELSLRFPPGASCIIVGPSGSGKSSILRVIAGLWQAGQGVVTRPPPEEMMFLPQQPYVPVSTLREALCYPRPSSSVLPKKLLDVLHRVNLSDIPTRVGGLDVEKNWREVLSLGEQQRLSFARLVLAAPSFAVLDEATSALDPTNQLALYTLLEEIGATVISVGHRESLRVFHDFILQLVGDGTWMYYPAK